MSKKIHPTLATKLLQQKKKYEKITAFAELFPQYSRNILDYESTGESYFKLTERHKSLYLAWGACWQVSPPTNYPEDQLDSKPFGLVSVYINVISLFGDSVPHSFGHSSLGDVLKGIKVHFYDSWNSTFYFLPEELEEGLDKLNDWYVDTKAKIEPYLKQKRKEELEKQLKELE